ncbi:MAG: RlmE family RNA methyltransferase [Buchnera aphidicola (Periphyllus lyropictus)]|uniref:RlmE family RNA methyltransferase n=1 Tax=Buchnera aphidicola TaxID=9 RepID=UPI001EBAB3F7|nr:RlmE family RNA methyltransferase [Buchnera aphidicola]NIH16571.1 RlmE family RNA methyltransferase [Buchnera aphidicola (Periphyllus lyropictus)]USS94461.1 RlmE family RNA methyltransferase [Buchnera aphidicola (Periphyllus lyropictus)]
MIKKKKSSSKRWLKNYFKDFYVKKTHKKKLRSRAWFKIDQIDKKFKIFKYSNLVLDIGCSPGSWSEYASKKVHKKGKIFSCDIRFMNKIPKVTFIQGDIRKNKTYSLLISLLKNKKVDLIMSDLSPKTTGHSFIDVYRSICLSKIAFNLSKKLLYRNGFFLTKVFQGEGFNLYLKLIKKFFNSVVVYKPNASRVNSREIFILAKNIKIYE